MTLKNLIIYLFLFRFTILQGTLGEFLSQCVLYNDKQVLVDIFNMDMNIYRVLILDVTVSPPRTCKIWREFVEEKENKAE